MWQAPPGELEDRERYYPLKSEEDIVEERALRTAKPRVVYEIPEDFWAGDEIHRSSSFRFFLSAVLVFSVALVIFLLIYLMLIILNLYRDPWIIAVTFFISVLAAIPIAYISSSLKATIETTMSAGTLIEYKESAEEKEGEILDAFAESTEFGRVRQVYCDGDCKAYEDPDSGIVLKMFRYTRPKDGRKFIIVVVSLKRNGDEEVYRRVKHSISEKWNKRDYTAILQV